MDSLSNIAESDTTISNAKKRKRFDLRHLRISLKHRPKIYQLILKLRHTIKEKNQQLKKLLKKSNAELKTDASVQTDAIDEPVDKPVESTQVATEAKPSTDDSSSIAPWSLEQEKESGKSIAEQVAEVAQTAMAQTGMVYVESAGMYYDYKTGYYYNSQLCLYYHPDTGCYYYYSEKDQKFEFHSYPDTSAVNTAAVKREQKKAKKHKQEQEDGTSIQTSKSKRKKTEVKAKLTKIDKKIKNRKDSKKSPPSINNKEDKKKPDVEMTSEGVDDNKKEDVMSKNLDSEKIEENDCNKDYEDGELPDDDNRTTAEKTKDEPSKVKSKTNGDLEDGECSETDGEGEASGDESSSEDSEEESGASTASASDDDTIAKHHPPCMRIIVKETKLPKLKVGSLFLITKDGGTVGREGEQHTILLREQNVSRNHLDIRYDYDRRMYVATDLGSKNGSVLNGNRMSESQVVSAPIEVLHGSTLQLGETKLLCHIHQGNDTCGHCEPGLVMAADEKEKQIAYTRNCSVQKQHQLELARLKNKYAPEPLMIEDGSYKDRAKERRETVGSSHGSEKTQQSDLDTNIPDENKGFKLLSKMGWSKGEGLGKDKQGTTEPIPLINNEAKVGLGAAGSAAPVVIGAVGQVPLKMARRNRTLRPPARLFRDPLEEDD